MRIIECVPNISEGRDEAIIKQITDEVVATEGVTLLDVDPGKATNRTVITFVGEPENVIEAAFKVIKKSHELIDMSKHSGEHPRMGATDVCPMVPVSNVSMEEVAEYARTLAKKVGEELNLPVYCYESAAFEAKRKNLATVRSGEYEGLKEKMQNPEWKPDFGTIEFNPKFGAVAVGARNFLVAYNINLNTTSVRRANSIAFDVREQGRAKREGNPITGKLVTDEYGTPLRVPGACKAVKGIGWFIEEYGIAQLSMNLTDISITPIHVAFEEARKSANKRGMRITGSELIGLVPLQAMLDAGKYFLKQQERSVGISELEIIKIAVKSLGLDDLTSFDPQKKIIEYAMANQQSNDRLVSMTLKGFADETASESPAPGGGSVAAYLGALGISLATMVANLSSHKRGWDDQWEYFSDVAEKGQILKDKLVRLVDKDTDSFNAIMAAIRLPKGSDEEKAVRNQAIIDATKFAIEVPFDVMKASLETMEIIKLMAEKGNPNSISDAGVGALCARSAVMGAFLNVKINTAGFEEKEYVESMLQKGQKVQDKAIALETEILEIVNKGIGQ